MGGECEFSFADLVRHVEWDTRALERRATKITASRVPLGAAKPQYKQQQHEEDGKDMPGHATTTDHHDDDNITSSFKTPQTPTPRKRRHKRNKQGNSKGEPLSFMTMTALTDKNDNHDADHNVDASCCTYDDATQDNSDDRDGALPATCVQRPP